MGSVRFSFDGPEVLAAVTGREGGVSTGELAGLNLSFEVGDDPARVIANRKIAGDELGFDCGRGHGSRAGLPGARCSGRDWSVPAAALPRSLHE